MVPSADCSSRQPFTDPECLQKMMRPAQQGQIRGMRGSAASPGEVSDGLCRSGKEGSGA